MWEESEKIMEIYMGDVYAAMPAAARLLLKEFHSAEQIYGLTEKQLGDYPFLSRNNIRDILQKRDLSCLQKNMEEYEKKGISWISIASKEYPESLRNIREFPYMLYYKGRFPSTEEKCVSIIGARKCSDYGRRTAAYFGRELAAAGVSVVSGMAIGIDGLAQSAAVYQSGRSYGILGSGVDVIYPAGNKELYHKMLERGGVISEFLPGTAALSINFPQRNRIISALAKVVLVIEARERSGTAITVNCALEQGRDVCAVPGRIEDVLSAGCNRLIRDGAGIASCAEDVLLMLGLGEGTHHSGRGRLPGNMPPAWREGIRPVIWKCLKDRSRDGEEVFRSLLEQKISINIQEVMMEMMQLQIEGLVECRGGIYSIA